jgi:hypothetical protein
VAQIRWSLAQTNPGAYLPHLATSLNNQSVLLGEAGRTEKASRVEEGVLWQREGVGAIVGFPDVFRKRGGRKGKACR